MNLKEAFRFQNKLSALMEEAQAILSQDANVMQIQNTYLRRKVMEGAEDETTIETPPSEFAAQITEVAKFLIYLLREKEKLGRAIRTAKNALPIDMDSEVGLNGDRQAIARTLRRMAGLRSSESLIPGGGTGYRFNQEGNQVMYRCDVKRVATIHFNRVTVRNLASEMDRKADATSEELDRCLVNAKVNYDAPFDVNDAFAEVFETFAGGENA